MATMLKTSQFLAGGTSLAVLLAICARWPLPRARSQLR
jgi:hypothetical protein